jgi:hypothetical protein
LDLQMHLFRYQSIAKHCIVLDVKFEDGSSISVLRNKALQNKKLELKTDEFFKVQIFQKPPAHKETLSMHISTVSVRIDPQPPLRFASSMHSTPPPFQHSIYSPPPPICQTNIRNTSMFIIIIQPLLFF